FDAVHAVVLYSYGFFFSCHHVLLPDSILFPYTTLFRSRTPRRRPRRATWSSGSRGSRRWTRRRRTARRPGRTTRPPARAAADRRDRKSTRLNSSHVSISYAVFCLKKKRNLRSK